MGKLHTQYIAGTIIERIDLILDRMYLTSILEVQYLQIGLHNGGGDDDDDDDDDDNDDDDDEVMWCANKRILPSDHSYRKVSNVRRTKSQNLNASRLTL